MKHEAQRKSPKTPPPATGADEIQQGGTHGPAKDERLKREVKQHPQRDEPRVDSVEPGELPPP
jgi:hypothetical protein